MSRARPAMAFIAGAAVTVAATIGVLHGWNAGASSSVGDTTFVPVAPCRLFDYRPAPDKVGPKSSPLGPGEVYTQPVTGANGNYTIPSDATAVAMNVTAVNPTRQSNLRIYPANLATPPTVSNINFTAGQKPVANKVDVRLSPDGKIKLLNASGSVFVIGDVVGYYRPTSLAAMEARIASLEKARPFTVFAGGNQQINVLTSATPVRTVTVTAPVAGTVSVTATHTVNEPDAFRYANCSITTGVTLDGAHFHSVYSGSTGNLWTVVTLTRAFPIAAGATVTYKLLCENFGGFSVESHLAIDSTMTALFTPV